MVQAVALAIVVAAGGWLILIALAMALRPATCIALFARMTTRLEATDWRLQLTEQGLRILVGIALILRAPVSQVPAVFTIAGGFLVATSLIILLAPIRWHGHYGRFWLPRLTPPLLRGLSPVPALVGAGIIYAAI